MGDHVSVGSRRTTEDDPVLPVKQSEVNRLVSEWSGRTGRLATDGNSAENETARAVEGALI